MEWLVIVLLALCFAAALVKHLWPDTRCEHRWRSQWSGRHGRKVLVCRDCGKTVATQ